MWVVDTLENIMAKKSVKMCLLDMLDDLTEENFKKFCYHLLDRREEPTVRRNKVDGKSRLEITDVLVSTFTENGAARVSVEILKMISCNAEADELVQALNGRQ